MSIFSPITARSAHVRWIYLGVYLLLAAGGLTMILPLLVSLTGSVAGGYDGARLSFFPQFLVHREDLWRRYLDSKYLGRDELLSVAWGREKVVPADAPLPSHPPDLEKIRLWERFVDETHPPEADFMVGFTRPHAREAAYYNRQFADWVLKNYGGSIDEVNQRLKTDYQFSRQIVPPSADIVGPSIPPTNLSKALVEFSKTVPLNRKIAWNVENYYRLLYLPQRFGGNIQAYNEKYGTSYRGFSEIPVPDTAPEIGKEPWFTFVARALSPKFIELTAEGESARQRSGMEKQSFIRAVAKPEDVKISSLSRQFGDWAAQRGIVGAQIPQEDLDYQDFLDHGSFWTWQFLTQNYLYVLNAVGFQGVALRNTFLLVLFTVVGALIVNPMAAYTLSRFKLRQSYIILLFFLVTISFPAEVTLIPNFLFLKNLGWLNTFAALVIPGLVNGFSIFLLKGFFDSLPRELYEAAEIDGAGEFTIFWGITMNLSKPILAVIALSAFTSAYGAFMFALIIAPDPKMWTLMVFIYQLRQSVGTPIVYASVLLTAAPVLIVFLCAQNIILRGIVVPSDK